MMAASVAVFGLFGWYQARRTRSGRDPLIEGSLFRKRAFNGGLVTGLVFFSGMSGFMLVFNLYTQIGLHYSPLKAGLAGVPWSVGMIIGFGLAQPLLKFGRRLPPGRHAADDPRRRAGLGDPPDRRDRRHPLAAHPRA